VRAADERAGARTNHLQRDVVAAIGNGDAFAKGRDFAAWLGLVPKQISTGIEPSWAASAGARASR